MTQQGFEIGVVLLHCKRWFSLILIDSADWVVSFYTLSPSGEIKLDFESKKFNVTALGGSMVPPEIRTPYEGAQEEKVIQARILSLGWQLLRADNSSCYMRPVDAPQHGALTAQELVQVVNKKVLAKEIKQEVGKLFSTALQYVIEDMRGSKIEKPLSNIVSSLETLMNMKLKGQLSDREYELAKRKLLGDG